MIFSYICILSLLFADVRSTPSAVLENNNQMRRYGVIQIVMEDLQNQQWADDEVPCLNLLIRIMKNVQNSTVWATWIWDSMQNPVGHLYGSRRNYGNYDECVDFPWEKIDSDMRTQYCLTNVHLSDVDLEYDQVDLFGNVKNYLRSRTRHHLKFNKLNWGVCTPVSCKPHSVTKFVSVLFRQTHLGLAVDTPNITIEYCDIAGDSKFEIDFGFCFTLLILALVGVFILLATWIVNFKGTDERTDLLKTFDIITNIESLPKIGGNEIRSLLGIRVISCFIMTALHVWLLMRTKGAINALNLNKQFDILFLLFPWEMTVDTFLFISGLLLVKILLQNNARTFNPLKAIVKRYIRTAFCIGFALLVYMNLLKNIARGPAMNEEYDLQIYFCNKYWWSNLLLIQNYVDPANMCYGYTWSAAVDFHLTIIGTLICWVFLKNRRVGTIMFVIAFVTSILTPAIYVYYRGEFLLNVDFRFPDDYRNYGLANPLHSSTHLRASGYFVGMVVGYIMYKYDPVANRNVISKKHSIVGFCVFLAIFSGIFVVASLLIKYGYTLVQAILYASLKRVIWTVLIGILIIICEYGQLPLVTSFLSSSAWAPIAKLSFGIYLVHGIFITYSAGIMRNPPQFEFIGWVSDSFGVMVFSSLLSLLMWLFIEIPMNSLLVLVFKSRKIKKNHEIMKTTFDGQQNGVSETIRKKTI